jgi:hypothetical protein
MLLQRGKMHEKRSRHGLSALKARVTVRGLGSIDMRTAAARSLIAWRNELLRDLGGDGNISSQRLALVEMAVRTRLYVDHVDAYLMEQSTLVNKRKKSVLPVLKERQALVDSLARLLAQIGLERQAKPVKPLDEYIKENTSA